MGLDNKVLLEAVHYMEMLNVFTGEADLVQERIIKIILEEKTAKLYEVAEFMTHSLKKKLAFEIDASKFDML
jgi:hypothetical protein